MTEELKTREEKEHVVDCLEDLLNILDDIKVCDIICIKNRYDIEKVSKFFSTHFVDVNPIYTQGGKIILCGIKRKQQRRL